MERSADVGRGIDPTKVPKHVSVQLGRKQPLPSIGYGLTYSSLVLLQARAFSQV